MLETENIALEFYENFLKERNYNPEEIKEVINLLDNLRDESDKLFFGFPKTVLHIGRFEVKLVHFKDDKNDFNPWKERIYSNLEAFYGSDLHNEISYDYECLSVRFKEHTRIGDISKIPFDESNISKPVLYMRSLHLDDCSPIDIVLEYSVLPTDICPTLK